MNQLQKNQSPTNQHQQLFNKNNRLYQQLLQSDYFRSEVLQNKQQQSSNSASIKFNISYQNTAKKVVQMGNSQREHQGSSIDPRHQNLFKSFETNHGKGNSFSYNKSYPETFSILEHENEENSTINIYSLSRNQIDSDLSLSSNNVTVKVIPEEAQSSQPFESAEQYKTSNVILNNSIMQQTFQKNQVFSIEYDDKFKKYRSEQYSYNNTSKMCENTVQDTEQEGKVQKLLAEKYMKNDISRKFSGSHNSENDDNNFKTVVNEIHIVPYKINNQIKPYAFTVPSLAQKKPQTNIETYNNSSILPLSELKKSSLRANSMNLNNSNRREQDVLQENTNGSTQKKMYSSNHPHHKAHQKAGGSFAYHPPVHSEPSKMHRIAPKSEPKYHHNQQKTIRSNSIENKAKPFIGIKLTQQHRQNQQVKQIFEHSQVTKLYKANPEENINPTFNVQSNVQFQQESIIYQSYGFDVCCGFTRNQCNPYPNEKETPNKINYLSTPSKQRPLNNANLNKQSFNKTSAHHDIEINHIGLTQPHKGAYKINSIQAIKEKRQVGEEEMKVKKGLRILGYGHQKIQQ